MSEVDERNPVLDGNIDYGRVFVTFTEHTDQKIIHGLIFRALLHALKEPGVLLRDEQPTVLVDLGCGEGHTAREMIDAINRVHPRGHGVDYYGLDADERFVRRTERLLTEVRGSQRLGGSESSTFGGRMCSAERPCPWRQWTTRWRRWSTPDQTRRNIAAIIDEVARRLGHDSLGLFVHSADSCPLATLRASVTTSVEAKPAGIVADVAQAKELTVISFAAPFKVHFPPLAHEQWEDTKEPSRYGAVRNRRDPRFVATLELLTFVAQRDLSGLAAQGVLAPFVDELRAQIDAAGAVAGVSNYQLMLPRVPSSGLRGHVEDAVRQVQRSLDRIRIESDEVFRRRAKQAP